MSDKGQGPELIDTGRRIAGRSVIERPLIEGLVGAATIAGRIRRLAFGKCAHTGRSSQMTAMAHCHRDDATVCVFSDRVVASPAALEATLVHETAHILDASGGHGAGFQWWCRQLGYPEEADRFTPTGRRSKPRERAFWEWHGALTLPQTALRRPRDVGKLATEALRLGLFGAASATERGVQLGLRF